MKLFELHQLIEQLGLAEHGDKEVVHEGSEWSCDIDGLIVHEGDKFIKKNTIVLIEKNGTTHWDKRFIPEHEK